MARIRLGLLDRLRMWLMAARFSCCLPRAGASRGTARVRSCTAPGTLDNRLPYAARLKVCSCQAARMALGLRWPFFSISHSAL